MKIKLLANIPVALEHGMEKDRVFEVVRTEHVTRRSGNPRWVVMGDAGIEVGVLPHEAMEVEL